MQNTNDRLGRDDDGPGWPEQLSGNGGYSTIAGSTCIAETGLRQHLVSGISESPCMRKGEV